VQQSASSIEISLPPGQHSIAISPS